MRSQLIAFAALAALVATRIAPEQSAPNQVSSSHLQTDHKSETFRFERKVKIWFSNKTLADENISGQFLMTTEDVRRYRFQIEIEASSRTFLLVALDDQGQIQKVLFQNSTPAIERLSEDLIQQFFFFQKKDLQGEYLTEFLKIDPVHFQKHKLKYLDAPYDKASVLESNHFLTLDSNGNTNKVEGTEALQLEIHEQGLMSKTSYLIEKQNGALARSPASTTDTWHEPSTEKNEALQASLEGVPETSELLRTLRNGISNRTNARLGLFRGMLKRISAEPTDASLVADDLPLYKTQPHLLSLLIGVLASSTNSNAQQALFDVFHDNSYPPNTRQMILNAWISTDAALPVTTKNFVQQLASDPATPMSEQNGALLALGSQDAKSSDPSERAQIETLLIQKLTEAEQDEGRIAALDAIGNAGSSSLIATISPYLSFSSDSVRAHAFLALRRIPGDLAENLIIAGKADPSPQVQDSARIALNQR